MQFRPAWWLPDRATSRRGRPSSARRSQDAQQAYRRVPHAGVTSRTSETPMLPPARRLSESRLRMRPPPPSVQRRPPPACLYWTERNRSVRAPSLPEPTSVPAPSHATSVIKTWVSEVAGRLATRIAISTRTSGPARTCPVGVKGEGRTHRRLGWVVGRLRRVVGRLGTVVDRFGSYGTRGWHSNRKSVTVQWRPPFSRA